MGGGPPVEGRSTNDHMVAMSEAALVVASMLPYAPGRRPVAESASALQIRPPSAPQAVRRVVTTADGVQAVVVLDLSAQYDTTQSPSDVRHTRRTP